MRVEQRNTDLFDSSEQSQTLGNMPQPTGASGTIRRESDAATIELGSTLDVILPTAQTEPPKAYKREPFSIDTIPSIWSIDCKVEWVIEELLVQGGINLFTGDSGLGKSTLVLAMCCAVARGLSFVGRETKARKVLYIDRENPASVVADRIRQFNVPETPNLKIWGGWVDSDEEENDPDSYLIKEFARREKPLIVFDSLVAFHSGREQDASETRRHMQTYRDLADLGATVVVIHHTGKGESSREYRGSSDIKASVDLAWKLGRNGRAAEGNMAITSLIVTPFKCRMAPAEEWCVDYQNGQFLSGRKVQPGREILEEIIRNHPGRTQTQLVTLAKDKVGKNQVETILREGEGGWLAFKKGDKNSKQYWLVGQAHGGPEYAN